MKILIFANSDSGLYLFRREILAALIASGHEVLVSVPQGRYSEQLKEIGVSLLFTAVNRRGVNPLADFRLYRNYRKMLKEHHPDIVFTYTIKPNVYGGIACQKEHIPYIANVTGLGTSIEDGGLLSKISLFLYKKGLQGAKCVFFQNTTNRQFFLDKGIVNEDRIKLLPGSGVNLENYPFDPYPEESKDIRFLFVGRLMRDKGIGELLQAIDALHKENPQVTLDIVGSMEEASWNDEIQKTVESGAARYHGPQKDVRPFYRNCHCVVLPSYHEGMANVLLEGSAIGRPVIATDVPGCRETFEDGVTGISCKAKDAETLGQAMRKFVSLDYAKRAEMGANARKRVEKLFSRKIVIQKYLDML